MALKKKKVNIIPLLLCARGRADDRSARPQNAKRPKTLLTKLTEPTVKISHHLKPVLTKLTEPPRTTNWGLSRPGRSSSVTSACVTPRLENGGTSGRPTRRGGLWVRRGGARNSTR